MFEQKIGGVKMKNQKGFTLVELLVVIAIIGILSSVAVVNLNAARDKAKKSAVLASLSGLSPIVQLCLDVSSTANLNSATMLNTGAEGTDVCSSTTITANWPKINQHGYNYKNGAVVSSAAAGTWSFKATNTTTGGTNINCSQSGCQ